MQSQGRNTPNPGSKPQHHKGDWDVMETIADQSTWANDNGKF